MNRRSWLMSLSVIGLFGKKKKELKFWGVFLNSDEGVQLYSISKNPMGLIFLYISSSRIDLLRGGWPDNVIRTLNSQEFLGPICVGNPPSVGHISVIEAEKKLLDEIMSWDLQSGDVLNFYSVVNKDQREFIVRVL